MPAVQDGSSPTPKGFAPALTPPGVKTSERPSGQIAAVAPPAPSAPRSRRPTDPEIETYLEIEADEPPEYGLDAELESELALNIAFSGDLDRLHESASIRIEDGDTRVTETSTHTLTLSVSEPALDHAPVRKRPITAQDSAAVSGTISIPDDGSPSPPRRAKRQSDGWDD